MKKLLLGRVLVVSGVVLSSLAYAQEYRCATSPPGLEVRYFLTSNFMPPMSSLNANPMQRWNEPPLDLDRHAWYQSDPEFSAPYGSINRDGEWEVHCIGPSSSTILTLQQGGPNSPLSRWCGASADTNSETGAPEIATMHCDFIYRFPEQLQSVPRGVSVLNDTVFDDAGNVLVAESDTLTNAKYQNYVSNLPAEENRLIVEYPRARTHSYYAVERLAISVDAGDLRYRGHHPSRVTISLKVKGGFTEMYIRGFRLRSNWMENLIEGKKNARLTTDFRALIAGASLDARSLAIQDLQSMTTGCGELPVSGFRAVAYIDNQFYHCGINYDHTARHIEEYLPATVQNVFTTDWYRSVYEDETDRLPPSKKE